MEYHFKGEIKMIDKKDIFMSGFKSKIGYSFTYKDLNEFEAIIDFYEQQCKKQQEVIDKINLIIKGVACGGNEDYYMEKFSKINELIKEVQE